MANVLNKDPASYAKEKASFLRDLQHFHDTRGTPSRAPPRINGKEIDLYLLYVLVTAQGGWVKVNQRNDWKNLLENFGLVSFCVNSEVSLKQIYLRYLDRYEKINFLGETGSIAGDDDEDSRHKKWSARALHSVPLVYNHHQHTVTEQARSFHGLSTNLYKPSDYDKLSLSLLSPLPNEQDLAINVCILLSNENKHAIKLSKCPKILHHLLAHAGVFTHPASRKFWEDYYHKVRKWSIKTFWKEVMDEKELAYLTDESRFCARTPETPQRKDDESSTCSDDDDDCRNKVKLNFDSSDDEIFGLKRPLGTDDPYGQRVYQVALILRNLTFFDENMKMMGQDLTFLRFVLLCCATRWNCLHQIGFEMLGNIGPVVPLDVGSLQHATLNIVCKNITESNDRAVILSAVEALNKMGTKESNEEFLLKNINQNVYDKICNMLSLHDIMLLIQTLECLYSLSSLGERACNAIVHVHGVIDTLVSLITVEAQAYGPKACILMRVIETVTGPSISTPYTPDPAPKSHIMAAPSAPPPSNASQHLLSTFSSPNVLPLPTPAVANPVILPNAPCAVPVMSTSLNTFTSVAPTGAHPVQSVANPKIIVPATTMTVTTNTTLIATSQTATTVSQPANLIQQENEQFALNWIRATLEVCPTPGRGIDQAELYKLYMTACARAGRRGVIAPLHFPRCVKSVFGPSVGPKSVKLAQSHGGLAMDPPTQIIAYEGIQVRSKPLPFPISTSMVVTQSTSVTAPSIPTSPILKAQLSAPATNAQQNNTLIKRELLGKTVQNLTLSTSSGTETSVITTTLATTTVSQPEGTMLSNCNTSLIKTLLASKVCDPKSTVPSATIKLSNNESCTLYASSQNCHSTVITEVTQRQQQQKILQQQNSATSSSPSLSSAVPKQIPKINGLRIPSEEGFKNDSNTSVIKSDFQPTVITTVASSIKNAVNNSLVKLMDNDNNEAVLLESKKESLPNGTPEIPEINDVASKSIMLSGLLDKEIEKKDAPFLYGSIQVGDNGLELNGACNQKKNSDENLLNCSKIKQEQMEEKSGMQSVKVIIGNKRLAEEEVPYDKAPKKPHLNGNSSSNDDENMEIDESNVKASSTAANLYAALAADVLEDIDGLEDESPKTPAQVPQQIQVSQATNQQIFQAPGQIIVSSANTQWSSNNQRGIVTMVHQGNSGGPQYVLAQPQSALVQGQAQTVLVAQTTPQGSGAKTIIILQQQPGNNNQSSNTVTLSQTNFVQTSSAANQSKVIVQRIPTPPQIKQQVQNVVTRPITPVTSIATKQQVKVIKTVPHIVSASMPSPPVQARLRSTTPMKVTGEVQTPTNQGQFLCEWRGCMRNFKSANEVYMHACESHCPFNGVQEMQCLWERCDSMKRKRFSLMTHLYDRHCNPDVLRMMAVRRRQLSQSGRSEIPAPSPPTPHPGYAPNAAFNAIKRHALEFVNPKELQDDNEGPVTKSIRLTSALILRNLVIYSSTGRWHIRRYEAHLSNIALSNVESSRTIAQLLFDLCHSS
ncbi:AT-rich interactive domain-containing protein 2 isoform X2 [Adelges cooleyi]|uniref:AT-rich interactive domain-containing protein 2 isoform X2 n=1 Tax=Adelges cooleyi TaxID=133065 RepID=UPI00217F69C2|nr:AT-rich interactive domain-containing protein 2 isoform X2 [Adelges cooleyi]